MGRPERETLYRHAARQAATAAEYVRCSARGHPTAASDTAGAAADALHSAARALHDPELQRAADAYDRAARPPYGRIPPHTRSGALRHRPSARMVGNIGGDATLAVAALLASLLDLAAAVTSSAGPSSTPHRQRPPGEQPSICIASTPEPDPVLPRQAGQHGPEHAGRATAPAAVRSDFPVPLRLDEVLLNDPSAASTCHRPGPAAGPCRRARPSP